MLESQLYFSCVLRILYDQNFINDNHPNNGLDTMAVFSVKHFRVGLDFRLSRFSMPDSDVWHWHNV